MLKNDSGYQSLFPLSSLEIEMLPSLIKLRLATSVIVSSKRMLERPNDPYVIGRFLSHTLFSLENVVLFDKVRLDRLKNCMI
jgi:Ser/Thr protein kinase RdoA (MazF antagonist)